MSEPSAEANDSAEEVPKPRRRWGGVVLRGVIGVVAVAGLALGGYVVWTQAVASPSLTAVEQIEARTLELERGQQAAAETQQALAGRLDSLQANTQAHADLLDEVRAALARGLAGAADAPPTPARWRVAEVAYLLRIANHRLAMERDLGAAKALLEGADAVLADLDDFAFFEVRAQIAAELLALEDHEGTDIQGAYLKLEAIKGKLNQLPLRLPEYSSRQEPVPEPEAATTGEAAPEAESGGVWTSLAAIGDRLSELVRFRRHEGEAVRPLLAPEQAAYLEQHLRLALERAQLALLRRDAVIFAANIADVEAWLGTYVDANHAVTKQLQAALAESSRLNVAAPLPDISGSLRALREVVPALEPSALDESTRKATAAPEGDAS
ncbi:MAG: uroporphyrinogen-III C-methyltransferase [Gammaproteobacteria bacterium]|nr:uroporphyrinogen-III C-methyltransferase [Gammaproteobacteria bacterium]